MTDTVLDSSALLALLGREAGWETVADVLPGTLLSTVNLAEVVAKLIDRGVPPDQARLAIEATGVELVGFDPEQAYVCGELRPATRDAGLSLGDRACLALARSRACPALTADRAWARLSDVEITLIR